jgi:hypothetical protein
VLYGDSPELQHQAMDATDPTAVPHVARALDAVELAFTALGAGRGGRP